MEQTDKYSLTQAWYDETLCEMKSMLIQDEWKKESIKKVNWTSQDSGIHARQEPGIGGTREKRNPRQAKPIWLKLDGKTDLGRKRKIEKRAREALEIRKAEVHVVHQGRSLDWEDVVELEEGRTVELIVTMKGGTRNRKKKKNKNRWNSDR